VAEDVGHDLHVDARTERERGEGVPKIVEADARHPGAGSQPVEGARLALRVERRTILVAEHEHRLSVRVELPGPRFAQRQTFQCLPRPPRTQRCHGLRLQRHGATVALGLRRAEVEPVGHGDAVWRIDARPASRSTSD
jgi:hypothetical protein